MDRIEAIIFDLGGTLINYAGVPMYWGDHYIYALQKVRADLKLKLSDGEINRSVEILKKYNPRLYPREIEYDSQYIFSQVTRNWNINPIDITMVVKSFFQYFKRNVIVYEDTLKALKKIKMQGYKTGILTDLPTGMPDELVREDIFSFEDMIDYWLSSEKCGYRKPNRAGLEIAEYASFLLKLGEFT